MSTQQTPKRIYKSGDKVIVRLFNETFERTIDCFSIDGAAYMLEDKRFNYEGVKVALEQAREGGLDYTYGDPYFSFDKSIDEILKTIPSSVYSQSFRLNSNDEFVLVIR